MNPNPTPPERPECIGYIRLNGATCWLYRHASGAIYPVNVRWFDRGK